MSDTEKAATNRLRNFGSMYIRRRYSILFYSLLFTLVAVPVLDLFKTNGIVIDSLLAANLLAAITPVDVARNRHVLFSLMVILWLARVLALLSQQRILLVVTLGIWTGIGMLAAASALHFAFRARRIRAEHVYAALSAYLLAGLFFGLLYWVLNGLGPGSFNMSGDFSRMTAIYFSFVTLATLGYGDIVPHTDIARSLAIMEGVGGQLFLAVLVARLVSLYASNAKPEQ